MSLAETAPELQASRNTGREQVEQAKEQTQAELDSLKQGIVWGAIPPTAQTYLSEQCKPANLALAINEAQALLTEDPTALDDPDISPFLLDICIETAEITAKKDVLETEKEANDQRRTTYVGLSKENEGLEKDNEALEKLNAITREEFDKGGSIDKKLEAIATRMTDVPNNKAALAKINQAREMIAVMRSVVTDPNEKLAFEQILSSSFVDVGADTMSVAFANVMDQVSASDQFTPETKAAISQKLGIVRHHNKVNTGGDINDVFKRGYGVETYQDENGEVKTRQIPLTKNNRIPIGSGQEIGLDERGGRAIWVDTAVGKYQASIPEQASDHDMGNIVRTIQMRASMHGTNMAEIFYPGADVFERGGGTIKIRTEDYTTTEKLRSILIGHEAIDGNKLFTKSDLDKIPYLMQFHSRQGDYVIGDVDPKQMREDYLAQGIIDENGNVDWERFEKLVMNNRAKTYTAPQDFETTVEKDQSKND